MAYGRYRRRYSAPMRRSFSGRRSWRKKSRDPMSGLMNPKFLGGVALGVVSPTVIPYQDALITTLAVLPVPKMGLGGVMRGYVLGRMGRVMVPQLGAITGIGTGTAASGDFV